MTLTNTQNEKLRVLEICEIKNKDLRRQTSVYSCISKTYELRSPLLCGKVFYTSLLSINNSAVP